MTRRSRLSALGSGLLGIALLVSTCYERLPSSFGALREVTVVTREWDEIAPTLERLLQQKLPTPQPEPEFKLKAITPDRLEAVARLRLLLLVGVADDPFLRQILGSRLDSLPDGEFGLYRFPNAWAREQWVLAFVAREKELLVPGLIVYGPRLHHELYSIMLDQMAAVTSLSGIDQRLTDSLKSNFGWRIDVPRGWELGLEHAQERFVYIYGHYPDRTIFVHWQDTTRTIVPDSILDLRDRLTGRFFEGDSVERSLVIVDTIRFLAEPALRLRGVWQNRKEVIGGPFVSYALNCQGRFFFIDGLVYNPGKKKLDNLFQVEALIRTFVPD